MEIKVPKDLLTLSEYFPTPLYAVGGFVRDSLLGFPNQDIDVTADVNPEEVFRLLKNSPYKVKTASKKLFTLLIVSDVATYEYTAFRKDNYTTGHRPESVVRTSDIKEDSLRRDFTVNAIYYDVKNKKIVDLVGGLDDLKNKIIRTPRHPDAVFSEDGLRLMRLARLASSLGFSIDKETLVSAQKNARIINEISVERIRDELNKILLADLPYGVQFAQKRGLDLLREIGILQYVIPELTQGIGMKQRLDFHKYDVYGHVLETVAHAHPSVRLPALMHDVAKPYCMETTGKYAHHDAVGKDMTISIMNRLRYPKKEIDETSKLVFLHMFNLSLEAKTTTVRKFVQRNHTLLDKLALLMYADALGSGFYQGKTLPRIDNLLRTRALMQAQKIPFTVSELLVSGTDMEQIDNIPSHLRGKALNDLLTVCATINPVDVTKEKQLKYLHNYK